MPNLRWPIIVVTTILALAIIFGFNYYHQRYMKEAPLVDELQQMQAIDRVEIIRETGETRLLITPVPGYQGLLREIFVNVERLALRDLGEIPQIEISDRRSSQLDLFAEQVTPSLFEAIRLGNYRSEAESVLLAGERYKLQDLHFDVDHHRLYLQARDGRHYLYMVVSLETPGREETLK